MVALTALSSEVQPEQMLTIDEVAARCRIGRTKAKQLIYAGDIRSVKIGPYRRIRESDLNEYLRNLPDAA